MTQFQQVIQLAKQSALKKFSVLIQHMAQTTDQELEKAMSVNSANLDYTALNAARQFLRKSGNELLQMMEKEYQQKLGEALDAMYSTKKVNVGQYNAATLTLIDDKTINRQIEVGHLVARLSASCTESLGRINSIVAQLLQKPDAREKDNPFRPELIAYVLYDALNNMVEHENVRHSLITHTTNSLARALAEYYAELCEVFKAGGISPKIYTRPTSKSPYLTSPPGRPSTENRVQSVAEANQENAGGAAGGAYPVHGGAQSRPVAAPQGGYAGNGGVGPGYVAPGGFAPEVLPTVERLLRLMQQSATSSASAQATSNATSADTVNVNPMLAFQGLVNNIFNASNLPVTGASGIGASGAGTPIASSLALATAPSPDFLARLDELQQIVASGRGADGKIAGPGNRAFGVGQEVDENITTQSERMALDLIAVLFELIGRDDQIPEGLRDQIGKLQIPFLKSALMDPNTLQEAEHPSRKLLNHMGMVTIGLPTESKFGDDVGKEIKRIVKTILADINQDNGTFVTCLEELKKFMDEEVRRADALTRKNIVAIEDLQRKSHLTQLIRSSVRDVLLQLDLDQRVVDFCLQIWVQVLVKASIKIGSAKGDAAKSTQSKLLLFFNALPDLVWSAQNKTTTDDRLTLITQLPKLVKIIKSGMKALDISEEESKQALDKLLAVHAQVLSTTEVDPAKKFPTLAELRKMFKVETIHEQASTSKATAPPPLDAVSIKAALAKKGIEATLHISPPGAYSTDVEQEWLADMQVGTRIESKIDGQYQIGRLIWVCKYQSLYMFRLDQSPKTLIYCPVSLSRALRDGTLMFVETAPTFERAVEALLQEAENLKQGSGN